MKLLLQRRATTPDWMFGVLSVDGQRFCLTLEDELREEKIWGESAIAAGIYDIALENSPKFGPDTLTLMNVPNFTYVRIHSGRTDDDTAGCILVGSDADYDLGVLKGGLANGIKARLQTLTREAIERGEAVSIEVRNAPGDRFVDSGMLVDTA